MEKLIEKVQQWGIDKGLTGPDGKATLEAQMNKLSEEYQELRHAIWNTDRAETIDGIGDMLVVLILLADMLELTLAHCLEAAYDVISKRTGTMIDGVFVKDR